MQTPKTVSLTLVGLRNLTLEPLSIEMKKFSAINFITNLFPAITPILQVSGHTDYVKKMDIILKAVGIQTCDDVFDVDSNMRKSKSYAPERGDSMPGCQLHRSKSDSVLVSRKMVSLVGPRTFLAVAGALVVHLRLFIVSSFVVP